MIRLLVIGHAYVVGANRGKLAAIAADPEIDLHVVCPDRWPEPEFGERVADPGADGYALHRLPVRGASRMRRARFARGPLRRAFASARPDVVQIEQEPASRAAFQCTRLARRFGARTILFAWDNVAGANRFPLDAMARWNVRRASYVLAGNRAALELANARGASGKSEVLPQLGLDDDYGAGADGDRVRRELGLSGFVVGFVARLLARKGAADLLEAFAGLGRDASLLLVGDGPERDSLARRAGALGVADRVRFAGSVPFERVADYLAAADCLVLPSRTTPGWAEQFGHVLIEAMALGVPVVGSDSGAIPEVIDDAGLVFPEGDVAGLRDAVARLASDADLRCDLAGRGRARVRERYTNRAIAARTVAVAREVLGR